MRLSQAHARCKHLGQIALDSTDRASPITTCARVTVEVNAANDRVGDTEAPIAGATRGAEEARRVAAIESRVRDLGCRAARIVWTLQVGTDRRWRGSGHTIAPGV